jgi:hypothetical protein
VDGKGAEMSALHTILYQYVVTEHWQELLFDKAVAEYTDFENAVIKLAEFESVADSRYPDRDWEEAHLEIEAQLRKDLTQAISILRYYSSHNNIHDSEIDALLDKYIEEQK